MRSKDDNLLQNIQHGQRAAAAGGILGAIAASSCCILPLLFTIGASGSWIGNLARLAPYQPYFIAITIACLACGFWLLYRSSHLACTVGEACGTRASDRLAKSVLILATGLVIDAIGFNFLAPLLYS